MAAVNNTLQATIITTDSNNNTPINRSLGNPGMPTAQFGDFLINGLAPNADTELITGKPVGTVVNQVYIKNLAAPGGATVTVKGTPNGGVAATLVVLQPGSVFIVWEIAAAASSGYTSLKVNASVADTPIEYFIGG